MLTNKLVEAIQEKENAREWASPIRLSNAGKCARAIAYQHLGFEMRPLTAKTRMKFKLGDLVEEMVKGYLRTHIPEEFKELHLPEVQEECSFECGEHIIKGHIDGRFTRQDGSEWLFECKSMGGYPFKKAKEGNIGYGYECQINCYMHALKISHALVFCVDRDSGATCEVAFEYNPDLIPEIKQRFISALNATKDDLPSREYAPNKKGNLPWQCRYCGAVQHCWPGHTEDFDKEEGYIYTVANYHDKND